MIKAILFDLDGTLVNSLADLAGGVNYTLAEYGYPQHDTESFKYFVGDGIPKMIERALPENARGKDVMQKCCDFFMKYYSEHFADKTVAYEGMTHTLHTLNRNGMKLAVVSNKAQLMADAVVNKYYPKTFDIIAGKRDGYKTKPDPTLTLEIIKKLGVKPQECIFAGDSGMDTATAVNCGAVPVGVLWGFRTRDELIRNGAKYIIEKPQQLLTIVKECSDDRL